MKLTKNDTIDVEYLIKEGLITSEKDLIGDNKPASSMFLYMVKKYGYLLNGDLLSEEEKLVSEVTKLQDDEYVARYAKEKFLYSEDGEVIIRMN